MSSKLFDIEGKVAIVTGGFGYLSYNFSKVLAEHGTNLIVTDIEVDKHKDKIKELKELNKNEVLIHNLDISDETEVEKLKDMVVDKYGRIDVLVNAAAKKTENFYMPFENFPIKDWDDILKVNLTGYVICCKCFGTQMVKQMAGSIINIASTYGVVAPNPNLYIGSNLDKIYADGKLNEDYRINTPAAYSVSKAGIIMLTQYLAANWGYKNVRVNCITPGGIYNKKENKEFLGRYSEKTPLGRKGDPTEINGALIYLASDVSSYVTGHNLIVDGGWTIW